MEWFQSTRDSDRLCFCRFTQLGFLRLLTNKMVMMDDVCTQQEAWEHYDTLLSDERIAFWEEPATLEPAFRAASKLELPGQKDWADSYLVAFAQSAGLSLVTFDRTVSKRTASVVLLLPKFSR